MIGLVTLPVLFVWFLFGKGYARSTRNAALFCTFTLPAMNILLSIIVYALGLPTT